MNNFNLRIAWAVVLALLPFWVTAQVTASFTGSPVSGCSPLVVQFTDASTGPVTSWSWNFGNGNTSTLQNPGAVYVTPGTYTVTLTVSGGGFTDTQVRTAYITVFQNPTAALVNTTPRAGCAPLTVCFNDISTPGSGAINGWLWDFGDGNTGNVAAPCHTYAAAGNYTVSLVVTDVNGCNNTVVVPNYVSVSTPPVANFTGSPLAACAPPLNVTFTNTSGGGAAPLSYQWNFGDGGTSTASNPTHTYNASGAYTVTLITTDANGCTDTLVRTSYINIGSVTAAFTPSTVNICEGQSVTFTDNSTGNPNTWNWDFGDGGTAVVQNPTHTYATAGTYTVTLTASNGACSDTEVQTALITVNPAPVANLVADTTNSCAAPLAVQFTDLSTGNPTSWLWDFGDGNTSTAQNPGHTYTAPGTYTVTLTVTNANGCTDVVTFQNYIQIVPPVADFAGTPIMGCIPLNVAFTDLSTSVEPIVSWQWDFGNGQTSTTQNPGTVYTTPGSFTVSLIIVNAAGCTDTIVRPAYIQAGTPPVACFNVFPAVACANDPVTFTDCSTNATGWTWFFGDGGTSNAQNPQYAYQDTGCFTVTLIASNFGCTDDTIRANVVCITPPVARFNLTPATGCGVPLLVTFTDNSILPQTWLWDFGDGNTSTIQNPTHTYTALGNYTVTLTVSDTVNGCVDDATANVNITDPQANFSGTPVFGCGPLTVAFTDLSTGATTYAWDFGDGGTSTLSNPTHTYQNPGTYTVTLVIGDNNGCTDTHVEVNYITVIGPAVDFSGGPLSGCDSLLVNFTDLTVPSAPILSWTWNFGDGNTSTLQNPSHNYVGAGTYNVSLTVTDAVGCTRTFTRPNYVRVTSPVAAFAINDTITCAGVALNFNNNSVGSGLTYSWDFGDGTFSSATNPNHSYAGNGTYSVQLAVLDNNGCRDTILDTGLVTISNVLANFTANPTNASCPPLLVSFTDQSFWDIVGWQWDFGDGTGSTLQNAAHVYATAGSYDVTLSVVNDDGCRDTLFMPGLINILGPNGSFGFDPDTGCTPQLVHFGATATNTAVYTWDFGDGTVAITTTDSVDHVYTQTGTFFPILILDDGLGCTFSILSPDSIVIDTIPFPNFAVNANVFCGLDTVRFTDLTISTRPVVSWAWDFGDGGTSTLQNPSHYYNAVGNYTVTLSVINTLGCTDTITLPANVSIFLPPTAAFAPAPPIGCDPLFVTFTDGSTGPQPITAWDWDFGNGNNSTQQNPTQTYFGTGNYLVTFIAIDSAGCRDTITDNIIVNPGPTAGFIADDSVGCPPMPVIFTANTGMGIVGFAWDFGDGTTGTGNPVTHTYPIAGNYTVTLVVTDTLGCTDTLIKPQYIHINPPVADFTQSTTSGCPPLTVTFTDASTATNGIVAWAWDFGDGNTGAGTPVTHTYALPGVYTVSLIVTDAQGCRDTIVKPNLITVFTPPVASFSIIDTTNCDPFTIVLQDASTATGTTVVGWNWSFGDGGTSTLQNPTHSYITPGNYTITLIATDGHGCRDTFAIPFISPAPPVANFTVLDSVLCLGELALFTADTAGGLVTFEWNFGGGSPIATGNPIGHAYNVQGSFTVTLIVTNAIGCKDTLVRPLFIDVNPPHADFLQNALNGCPGLAVTFTSISTAMNGIANLAWDFGDGGTATGSPVMHVYNTPGVYSVQLIVTDGQGCRDTMLQPNLITIFAPPIADFGITDTLNCDPFTIQLTDSSTSAASTVVGWDWNFGDGGTSTVQNPTHAYLASGPYTITLIATDANGCRDTFALPIIAPAPPVAAFTASDTLLCLGGTTIFTGDTTGGIISFTWDFGDGSPIVTGNPVSHAYTTVGDFTVTLIIENSIGCRDTITRPQYIHIHPPVADFTQNTTSGCPPLSVTFSDLSAATYPVVAWAWDFGDGNTGTGAPVTHTYALPGTYTVTLIITDSLGCHDTIVKPNLITVFAPPTALFGITDTLNCQPFTIQLTDSSSGSFPITGWNWNFGDGNTSTLQNPTHAYPILGTYNITLIATDANGCRDTMSLPFTVPVRPAANFVADDSAGCAPFAPTFTADSVNVASYFWNFGDGNTSTVGPVVTHSYPFSGHYTVTLIIQDIFGCSDTLTKPNYIFVDSLTAQFTTNVGTGCPPLAVTFTDGSFSDTTIVSWFWQFGDGGTSTLQNPVYTYITPGSYTVILTVTNAIGCTDSIHLPNFIIYNTNPPATTPLLMVTVESDVNDSISWRASQEPDFDHYVLWWEQPVASGIWVPVDSFYNVLDTTYRHYGLNTLNNSYCYRMQVVDICGYRSDLDSSQKHCTIQLEAFPGIDQAELRWNKYVGWDSVAFYDVYRVTDYDTNAVTFLGTNLGSDTTFIDSTMKCYEHFCYRVKAREFGGNLERSWSDTACATPIHVPNPLPLFICSASVQNDTFVELNWSYPPNANAMIVFLDRSEDGNNWQSLGQLSPTATSYIDVNVSVHSQSYYYRLSMIDSCGDLGPYSNIGRTILLETRLQTGLPFLEWNPYEEWPVGVLSYNIEVFNDVTQAWQAVSTNGGSVEEFLDQQTNLDQPIYCYRVFGNENGGACRSLSNTSCVPVGPTLFAPNAFTPNGDGLNELFELKGHFIAEYHFMLFDRWGALIFESFDLNYHWDGTWRDKPCQEGVFVWVATARGFDGTIIEKKGSCTLIR